MTYAIHPFTLHQPRTVAEALAIVREHPDALYLAGGTDLMVNLRRRMREPGHVVALGGVEELRGVGLDRDRKGAGTLAVGALTTMTDLSQHPGVRQSVPALAEAAGLVAGPTLRNMGTAGGNLVLDTRCRYYNQSYFWRKANDFCLKKDGTVCHVAPGGSFCWAAFSADTPPVWLLLDAELDLAGPDGSRTVKLREFYGSDGRWSIGTEPVGEQRNTEPGGTARGAPEPKGEKSKAVPVGKQSQAGPKGEQNKAEPGGLRPGELILRVRARLPAAGWEGVYEKLRVRDSIDYPLVGVALMIQWGTGGSAGRRLEGLGLALTGVNPRPEIVAGTGALVGRSLTPGTVEELKRLANRTAKPMRTTVADPAYRRAMVGALIEKAAGRLAPEIAAHFRAQAQWA
jgi:4-hydroxybenzoyl-CoA reductase subunit beta